MSENAPESNDDLQPIVDIQQLEAQLHCENSDEAEKKEEQEENKSSQNCLKWAYWYFFILPARIRELRNKPKQENESEDFHDSTDDLPDPEQYIPKTKTGRQIGVMHYILQEEGNICIEEMLYIDIILGRIDSFTPQMPGVDRYDDLGILNSRRKFRRFVEDFFTLSPSDRRSILADIEDVGSFSSELLRSVKRMENLASIPRNPKSPNSAPSENDKPARVWPSGLSGRDLELFKLLSGIETISPRSQALSVLNYILPDEPSSQQETPQIQMEPGDKKRIARLLKRFPCLKNRYPYLLKMIENDIPPEKFNANSDNQEYIFSEWLPAAFMLPSILASSPKESKIQKWFSNGFIKWSAIIAVVCALFMLGKILFHACI